MSQWLTLTATAAAQTVKIYILSPASCRFSDCWETKHGQSGQSGAGPAEALIMFPASSIGGFIAS